MIDESIRTKLSNEHPTLNFNGLLKFMENSGIDFKNVKLLGPIGMASYDAIYLDMTKIGKYHDNMLFFVILHEMAHSKRIKKYGKKYVIEMLSLEDFEKFAAHIIGEEIIADRYGSLMYYKLNGTLFPKGATQQLELTSNKELYKHTIRLLFGVVKNNEETYNKLLESFICKDEVR